MLVVIQLFALRYIEGILNLVLFPDVIHRDMKCFSCLFDIFGSWNVLSYIIVSLLWFYDNFSCDHRIQVASLPTGFRVLNYPCCTSGVNDLGVSALWLFLMWFLQQQNWTWITSLRFFVLMNIKFNSLWHSSSRVD